MHKQQRIILFDLGRVLIDFDHRIAVKKIKHYCQLEEAAIYDLFFDSDVTQKYERGEMSSLEFFKEVKRLLSAKMDYEDFVPIWNEIFAPHPGMREVLEELKSKHKLYLVSNINELHYKYIEENFWDHLKHFEHKFLSYALGVCKPDHKIYKLVIDYLKIPAQDIIYTDDRPELIEAAKNLNIDAFVFKGTQDFKKELALRDISV